jgi:hypothetical protein
MNRGILHVILGASLALAAMLAFEDPSALAGPRPAAPSASAASSPPAATASLTSATPPAAPTAPSHGLAPLPDDQRVPGKMLPPGAFDPDSGPSDVIYPTQQITIRFNHKLHMSKDIGSTCKTCHSKSATSNSAQDSLIPAPTVCDACHQSAHDNLAKVEAGPTAMGKCAFCHVGYKDGDGNGVAPLSLPRANLLFPHKKHVDRNIGCAQCHGSVAELELATRDQLPRMRGCFNCHEQPDSAARGEAKSACETCHIRGLGSEAGRMKTMFASGQLSPPRWLHNAAHTPDFIERHKTIAGNDSEFCANCHSENFCTDCHDGRVRPRSIHPNDFISMHPIEARMAAEKCTSCHREQSFCLNCHMRAGVSMSSPPGARDSGRFHPAKSIWSDPPMRPGHHGFEAQRNLNACVSCHTERDCVTCHGAAGIGAGFDPHRGGFTATCGSQFRRNPRPCLVCHEQGDSNLQMCR